MYNSFGYLWGLCVKKLDLIWWWPFCVYITITFHKYLWTKHMATSGRSYIWRALRQYETLYEKSSLTAGPWGNDLIRLGDELALLYTQIYIIKLFTLMYKYSCFIFVLQLALDYVLFTWSLAMPPNCCATSSASSIPHTFPSRPLNLAPKSMTPNGSPTGCCTLFFPSWNSSLAIWQQLFHSTSCWK